MSNKNNRGLKGIVVTALRGRHQIRPIGTLDEALSILEIRFYKMSANKDHRWSSVEKAAQDWFLAEVSNTKATPAAAARPTGLIELDTLIQLAAINAKVNRALGGWEDFFNAFEVVQQLGGIAETNKALAQLSKLQMLLQPAANVPKEEDFLLEDDDDAFVPHS